MQYKNLETNSNRILYCDSKGDKRFSALYAEVTINGVKDTIENFYQNSKRDEAGNIPGKGKKVAYMVFNGKRLPASKLTDYYKWLWDVYFKQHPDLLDVIRQHDVFIDRFKGKSINCQADVIAQIRKEVTSKMCINVVKQDLFTVPSFYHLAHCVSADFALGAGVAKEFTRRYNMRDKLKEQYRHLWTTERAIGQALLVDNTYNLVTKLLYWHKPTYETLQAALNSLKEQCIQNKVRYLAMPTIGCGLDRLNWNTVFDMICKTFENVKINILICKF